MGAARPALLCAEPGAAAARWVWRLFLSTGCSAPPLITRVELDKSKGETLKDNPSLALSHELSLTLKRVTMHHVQG